MVLERQTFTILMANDDADFCFLVKEALREIPLAVQLYCVENGEELLNYLYQHGKFVDGKSYPAPQLILLDLKMPKIDGKEALAAIKSDSKLRRLPTIVLTTSHQEGDIANCYRLGANSFLIRPLTFQQLVELMGILCHYWFEIVLLPPE